MIYFFSFIAFLIFFLIIFILPQLFIKMKITFPDIQINNEVIEYINDKEEKKFYSQRATDEWLKDLNKFETTWEKPFLEVAPALIIIFRQSYDNRGSKKRKNYYVNESVGIATGFLLTAIQNAGLVSLTHTPSPMGFLEQILERPKNEKAYLLIPIGFPAKDAQVPILSKKPYSESVKVL